MSDPNPDPSLPDPSLQPVDADEQIIGYSENHVIAIVDTREQLADALSVLKSSGFLDSEVSVVSGDVAAEQLSETTGRTGFADFVIRLGRRLGLKNDEGEMKDKYEAALRDGHYVVAIFVPSDARKELAAQLLASHGGRFVNFLGRLMIERLG